MKKKVFVIGSYWAGNLWDDAILESIKENLNDFEIIPCLPHLPFSIFKIPFRLQTLKNLKSCDVVLLWWWWLFSDNDTIKAIKIWGNAIKWAKYFNKKIYLYANSVWPFKSNESENLAKQYLKQVDRITVRDEISSKQIHKMWLNCNLYSDPAFTHKYKKNWGWVKKQIAISLRRVSENSFNHEKFNKYIETKEKSGYKVTFIFMHPSDQLIYEKYYKKKWRIWILPENYSNLLNIIEKCEICIWMRLHFLIASALLWKAMLAISYSDKVKWLMSKICVNSITLSDNHFDSIEKELCFPQNIDCEIKKVYELNNDFRNFVNEYT